MKFIKQQVLSLSLLLVLWLATPALGADQTFYGDITGNAATVTNLTVESAAAVDQDLTQDASPTFAGLTNTGLTASKPVFTDASKALTSTGTLTVDQGGTGATSLTDGGILLGSGTGAVTALGVAANGQIPIGDGTTDPVLATLTGTADEITVTNGAGTITLDLADPLIVGKGGTGAATFTDGGLLLGSGTGAFTALGVAANGQIPIGDGTTDPVLANITGTANQVTVTNGAGTIALSAPQDIGTASSPTFVTIKASGLADLKIPKHVDDATGLADTAITVSANNEVTNASQPSFLARPTAQLSDVTGDGTDYTVVFATEIFDQNADFDGTSTFTAPVTGRYLLSFNLYILGLVAGHNVHQTGLITSNRGFWFNWNFAAGANPFTYGERGHTVLVDMDAGDTAYVTYAVTGGALAVDISAQSYFSGFLAH